MAQIDSPRLDCMNATSVASLPKRVYIVGTGFIAGFHAKALKDIVKSNLDIDQIDSQQIVDQQFEIHVCDLDAKRRDEFATEYGATTHASLDEMLADSAREDDLVVVATPPASHAPLSIEALRTGRHVLCEKPLTMNDSEAREVLAVAQEVGRTWACCSNRFLDDVVVGGLKRSFDQGEFGDLYRVVWRHASPRGRTGIDYLPETMSWATRRQVNGGGVLMDWGPYDFTTINHILEPSSIEIVHASLATPEAGGELPDHEVDVEFFASAYMIYHTAHGKVPVVFERTSCSHASATQEIRFEGTQRAAEANCFIGADDQALNISKDNDGLLEVHNAITEPDRTQLHSRPMIEMLKFINGDVNVSIANESAVFNFACLRAIYDVAQTGQSTVITMPSAY